MIGLTGKLWLAAVLVVVVSGTIWLHFTTGPLDRFDAVFIRAVTSARTPWLDSFARGLNWLGSRWGLPTLGLVAVAIAAVFGRWRHLVVFLISLAVLEIVAPLLYELAARPRPYSITAIADWEGFSSPSLPVAALTAVLVGMVYMDVVAGRPRWYAKLATAAVLVAVGLLRTYLGIQHPSDHVFGVILGVAIPVALFRAFVPNDAFPVTYGRRGKSAHLDVGGRRGDAITRALREQLGLTILEMKLVGLEGSGGSTPLKLRVADEHGVERSVFAKLYAKNHVRADRWYKLGRTMLYGRLEDETPFKTVRRFVEYEDYTLRLLGEYGFATPTPLGIVEITPEREYLIAMEFFEDAEEIGDVEIDGRVIDEGLQMIRRMWDIGLAHRDIKPANLMVQDGHLRLIDVFFVQVRPSPWRQAVDLGGALGGVRRDTWCREPDAAPQLHEAGRTRPARAVPGGGPPSPARPDPAVEPTASRADTPDVAPRHRCGRLQHLAVLPEPGQRRDPGVRDQPNDDPDGPGGAIGHAPAVYPVASLRLEHLRRDDRARPRELRTHSNQRGGWPRFLPAAAGTDLGRGGRDFGTHVPAGGR